MTLPLVLATPEALAARPSVPTIYRIPPTFTQWAFVYGCPCGWLSRDHSTEERAAVETCPVCTERQIATMRRAAYVVWCTAESAA